LDSQPLTGKDQRDELSHKNQEIKMKLVYLWSKSSISAFSSKLSSSILIPKYGMAVASTKPVRIKLPAENQKLKTKNCTDESNNSKK
jgi:hypothetical protein